MRYLVFVSPWRHATNESLRRAFVIATEQMEPVNPTEDFPNNGQVFIHAGVNLQTHDLLLCEPHENAQNYESRDPSSCFYAVGPAYFRHVPGDLFLEVIPHSVPTAKHWSRTDNQLHGLPFRPTPQFCIAVDDKIVGPFKAAMHQVEDDGSWSLTDIRPSHPDLIVASVPREELHDALVDCPIHTDFYNRNHSRTFIRSFDDIGQYLNDSAYYRDYMSHDEILQWAKREGVFDAFEPESLRQLRDMVDRIPGISTELAESRFNRLRDALHKSEALEQVRRQIIADYLESDEGRARVESALELHTMKEMRRRSDELDELVGERKQSLELEIKQLEQQRDAAQTDLAQKRQDLEAVLDAQQNELIAVEELKESLGKAAQTNLDDLVRQIAPVLAVLRLTGAASETVAATSENAETKPANHMPERYEPPQLDPSDFRDIDNEGAFLEDVRERLVQAGYDVSYQDIANLYICYKSGYLTILAGPPGMGKSSMARRFVEALGHKERFLDIVVRRGWTDEQPLLGFVNHLERRYEPATTGLIEHLRDAEIDAASLRLGLYPVLLDEFNLSVPEHYFADFISVLERREPSIRLYPDRTSLVNSDAIPPTVGLHGNVHYFATVNIDESSSFLSRRIIDRANVVWVQRDNFVLDTEEGELPAANIGPISYEQMRRFIRPPVFTKEQQEAFDAITEILQDETWDLGEPIPVSARTRRAMMAYCSNSQGILAPSAALDMQLSQRILPQVHGFGEDFYRRLLKLRDTIESHGFERTLANLDRILARGKARGHEYSFLI